MDIKTEKEKTNSRLVVNVPPEFHKIIKINATEYGMTMSAFIIRAIVEKMDNDRNR